ncbi:sulfite exporter TauE/SafE family protein [Staphylococcus kloosii]|jgi:uncharacterized membrane protein YfcA|uniref:Probable membrane transporter protein n=1 Tax=Staphylococcus kloosii TaxID=29384 RepID=A0ABQ0XP22_9STAP|nr:sulfite exporter TauE/SafE family protein [Staphylococcus kloosii]AVQ35396.1 sulfite exporter TauE/SafE family protein [Staphylococcus kloosii]MBF7021333.1 sulfite exporter TauE/SafE family protein [Staphylococcus kloosii]PNZ02979.1 hypothetical protein CD136_11925 [Staphylococcus kloosii]PTJ76970.1 sulfite exporter TauE/SafE family protein [Staphylococcus kloosii]SUM48443.1 Sulfite exporter TauE/SafE [Staphylococcus kloosii]
MLLFVTMILVGVLIGFTGAGGAGTVIAILTAIFGIPVHTALGTSLASMIFTSLSGTLSHFKAHNVVLKIGLITGLFGAIGSFIGAQIAGFIDEDILKYCTAGMMTFSAFLLWRRLFMIQRPSKTKTISKSVNNNTNLIAKGAFVGIITGCLSGFLGIGAAPFIQIGLLTIFGLTAKKAVGTTMLVILPIAFVGGFGYYIIGHLDIPLFIKVVCGTIIGSYIGAKLTAYANEVFLKVVMIAVPIASALLLIFGKQ